jgi:hypothetical protein
MPGSEKMPTPFFSQPKMRVFNTGANKPGLGRRKRKSEDSKERVIENPLKLIEDRQQK